KKKKASEQVQTSEVQVFNIVILFCIFSSLQELNKCIFSSLVSTTQQVQDTTHKSVTTHNFCHKSQLTTFVSIFSSLYKQVTSHNSQAFYFHNSQKRRNGKQFDQCCCSLQAFVAKEQTNFNKHLTCNLQYH
ncbi:hypothetical protein MTR67_031383, partial [Solanum verrucosum]